MRGLTTVCWGADIPSPEERERKGWLGQTVTHREGRGDPKGVHRLEQREGRGDANRHGGPEPAAVHEAAAARRAKDAEEVVGGDDQVADGRAQTVADDGQLDDDREPRPDRVAQRGEGLAVRPELELGPAEAEEGEATHGGGEDENGQPRDQAGRGHACGEGQDAGAHHLTGHRRELGRQRGLWSPP
jgi:hypothetical protein